MEYEKIIKLLDDITNQQSKSRTRNCVEINDESRGRYDNSCIKFKTSMIRSNLRDYSDAYILVMGTITALNTATEVTAVNNTNKQIIFKNCATFANCITEINNTQVDDAKNTVIVMPMHNLIEYSDAYSKTSRSLWQYYRDEPALENNFNIINFPANNNKSISFKIKQQITEKWKRWRKRCWNDDTKLYVPVVTLSTQHNAKLLKK